MRTIVDVITLQQRQARAGECRVITTLINQLNIKSAFGYTERADLLALPVSGSPTFENKLANAGTECYC